MKTVCNDTGKVMYGTKKEAMAKITGLRARLKVKTERGIHIKRRVAKPKAMRIYYCEHCESYHLTSWSWWGLAINQQKIKV